jgi:DNA-binding transcriptional MocR family regulator
MTEYVVLGTKVEKEFAEKVQKYCEGNGLNPSSLIRALLEEELNRKKPLTEIYNEIMQQFSALQTLTLMTLETLLELSIEHAIEQKNQLTIAFKGQIPAEYLDIFQGIDRHIQKLGKRLKRVRELLKILDVDKKQAEKET